MNITKCYKKCLKVIKNNRNNNNNNIATKLKLTKCTFTAYNDLITDSNKEKFK